VVRVVVAMPLLAACLVKPGPPGGGTAAFVQAAQGMPTACADHQTLQFDSAPTPGDAIVVYAWSWSMGTDMVPAEVSDDRLGTYPSAVVNEIACGGANAAAAIYFASVSAAPTRITYAAQPGSCTELEVVAVEYEGISRETDSAMGNSPCPSDPCELSTGDVATGASTLLASVALSCAYAPSGVYLTDQAGFTPRASVTDAVSYSPGTAGDKIVHDAEPHHDTWRIEAGSAVIGAPAAGVIAAFQ
jgi:hypothetical protein